jgi:hypothetical protein
MSVGTLVAQSPPADPWTLVPPFPAACYRSEDFSAPADKAHAALEAARARQEEMNAAIEEEYRTLDMSEMAQRMQAFMMKDPERAMAMMQAMNAAGAKASEDIQRGSTTAGRLENELRAHTTKFQAAVEGVRNPIQAQIKTLVDAKALPRHGDVIAFATAAEEAQYLGLVTRLNADYDKICGAWWGPTGAFQGWLRDLRTHIAEDLILGDDQVAAAKAVQFAILETPSAGYRSTAATTGVLEYLRRARAVYELRPHRIEIPKSAR